MNKLFKLTLGFLLLFTTSVYAFVPPTAEFTADSSDVLLLHMNGTDASTTIPDDSTATNKGNATVTGNAQLDTAIKKLGSASLLLDVEGDYISYADHVDYEFTADFTIEWFFYLTNTTPDVSRVILSKGNYASGEYTFFLYPGATPSAFVCDFSPGAGDEYTNFPSSLSAATWYHLAITRGGSTMNVYLDGTSVKTFTNSNTFGDNALELRIGAWSTGAATARFDGQIDEFRMSKGINRYPTTSGKQFIMITKFINNLNPDKVGTPAWSCKIKLMCWWKNITWKG